MSLTPTGEGGSMSGVSDVTYDTVIRNGRWFDAALFGLTPQVVPDPPQQDGAVR